MRKFAASLSVAAFVLALGAPTFAKTATVKGQLVDQECYLMEKKVDSDKACAVSCAKERSEDTRLNSSHG